MSVTKERKKTPMEMKVTGKNKFDPSKSYEWKPDDEFVISGEEFSMLYHVLRQKATEGQAFVDMFAAMQSILESGVEEGTIKERLPQKIVTQ